MKALDRVYQTFTEMMEHALDVSAYQDQSTPYYESGEKGGE